MCCSSGKCLAQLNSIGISSGVVRLISLNTYDADRWIYSQVRYIACLNHSRGFCPRWSHLEGCGGVTCRSVPKSSDLSALANHLTPFVYPQKPTNELHRICPISSSNLSKRSYRSHHLSTIPHHISCSDFSPHDLHRPCI